MYGHTQQIVGAIAMVAALAVPRNGQAQALRTFGTPATAARAAALEATAYGLGEVRHYRQMVQMLEQAAELRPAGDPKGVADLIAAGSASYYSGKRTQARGLYVRAAERALLDGDVDVAARSYLMAAVVANELRDPARDELKARAERLAASPLLTEGQRRLILGQFGAPLQVAKDH